MPGSEHYVLGPRSLAQYVPLGTDDWIGFDHSAEAIVARYHLSGKDETLLIASYPTQQIAAGIFAECCGVLFSIRRAVVPAGQNALFGKRVQFDRGRRGGRSLEASREQVARPDRISRAKSPGMSRSKP